MVDKIELKDNSKERVALELLDKISASEKLHGKDSTKKQDPRTYYLKLYNQCLKVVSSQNIDINEILDK